MLGVVADESEGVVGVGVAGVAVEPAAVPESAGAGVVGVLLAGAGSDAAGGVAAGVAGASSRLLQPASTAVNTAAAKRVWRIFICCLLKLLRGDLSNCGLPSTERMLADVRQLLDTDYSRSGRCRMSENGAS